VGDLDGDRRGEVAEMRMDGVSVRAGKDGRVLFTRPPGTELLPVAGTGVRLVSLDVEFAQTSFGLDITVALAGLDRAGRAVWTRKQSGSLTFAGAGPAFAASYTDLPVLVTPGLLDAVGRPALLLGSLSGGDTSVGTVSSLALSSLSVADGSVTALPSVTGAGFGIPFAFPLGRPGADRSCYVAPAPAGVASTAALQCGTGAARWTRPVDLTSPSAELAGDFDGDKVADVAFTTFGFTEPDASEPTRGTRVLSSASGAQVGTSKLDLLFPLGVDASGDAQPDFMQISFDEPGFAIVGRTLAGTEFYRRSISLAGSGSLEAQIGQDITGDGVPDAYLRAQPERGSATGVVVEGRTGRPLIVADADGLVLPGLRARGGDLAVTAMERGRLRTTLRGGDRGQRLLSVVSPGPVGTVTPGAVATADLDGDKRRDLIVANRVSGRAVTTAFSATGRVLWQRTGGVREADQPGGVTVG
jgi:hypothetical protein